MLEFLFYISYALNGIGLLFLGWYVVRSMQCKKVSFRALG